MLFAFWGRGAGIFGFLWGKPGGAKPTGGNGERGKLAGSLKLFCSGFWGTPTKKWDAFTLWFIAFSILSHSVKKPPHPLTY